jgi:hypothetical protein
MITGILDSFGKKPAGRHSKKALGFTIPDLAQKVGVQLFRSWCSTLAPDLDHEPVTGAETKEQGKTTLWIRCLDMILAQSFVSRKHRSNLP